MARKQGLQAFLESKAEGPAFLIVFVCMIARAAQFYSGGALQLVKVLGASGMALFNAATGVGLAIGCELLFAIAGRSWQANKADAREAMAKRGMSRAEKAAMRDYYLSRARIAGIFCVIGLAASLAAAFSFLWGVNGDHSIGAVLEELIVAGLLVTVVAFLAIFKESRGQNPTEEAQVHAYAGRTATVKEAGARVASGNYSSRDVRVIARQLPRQERDSFEAALLPDDADDPYWTVRDLLNWLGDDSGSAKRRVQRRLQKLYDTGAGVTRDEQTGYRILRSIVLRYFSDEFLASRAPARVSDPTVTRQRQNSLPKAQQQAATGDKDTTTTTARQWDTMDEASASDTSTSGVNVAGARLAPL